MTAFNVGLTRLNTSTDSRLKYAMLLHPGCGEAGVAARRDFGSDEELCEALKQLGVPEPQQKRILSVLRTEIEETVPVDVSEEVAQEFGWARQG